jgi:hypothetical protein
MYTCMINTQNIMAFTQENSLSFPCFPQTFFSPIHSSIYHTNIRHYNVQSFHMISYNIQVHTFQIKSASLSVLSCSNQIDLPLWNSMSWMSIYTAHPSSPSQFTFTSLHFLDQHHHLQQYLLVILAI